MNHPKTPRTVSESFPTRWLAADDLNGNSYTLTIERVEHPEIHNIRTHQPELKPAVKFKKAEKMLILNKTQALAIAAIARSEKYSDWPGVKVHLKPGTARNGKPTIVITPPAAAPIAAEDTAEPQPQPQPAEPLVVTAAELFGPDEEE